MTNKKITLPGELVYVIAISLLAFGIAMTAASDLGLSMVAAPAFILNLKIKVLTVGQCEYIFEGAVFVLFCILMKRIRLTYFFGFLSGVFYGVMLDVWRALIPILDPVRTPTQTIPMPLRVVFFALGVTLTAFSVALCFHTYVTPMVVDLFPKGICQKYHFDLTKFIIGFNVLLVLLCLAMSLIFFRAVRGIGIGTLVIVCVNGLLIGAFDKIFTKILESKPLFPKVEKYFRL